MALFWQCNGDGIAIRSYKDTSNNNNVLGRNERGTIIKTFDPADDTGWLYQQEKYVNGSWVTSKGYTWASYYTTTSDPTPSSGGGGGGDSSGGGGSDTTEWSWGEYFGGVRITSNETQSRQYDYTTANKTIAYGSISSDFPGTITISHNKPQNLAYWLLMGMHDNVTLEDENAESLFDAIPEAKIGHGQITYQIDAICDYIFGIVGNGTSASGTVTVTFVPTVSYFTIQYFLDDPAPSWNYTDHIVGQKATLIDKIPEKSGYIFKGWSKNPGSLSLPTYYSGSSTDITESTILYAVWWPAFTWKDYTYSEFLDLWNKANTQYGQPLISSASGHGFYAADHVNKLRTTLRLSELTGLKGTRITKAPLNECSTCYNKVNAL